MEGDPSGKFNGNYYILLENPVTHEQKRALIPSNWVQKTQRRVGLVLHETYEFILPEGYEEWDLVDYEQSAVHFG